MPTNRNRISKLFWMLWINFPQPQPKSFNNAQNLNLTSAMTAVLNRCLLHSTYPTQHFAESSSMELRFALRSIPIVPRAIRGSKRLIIDFWQPWVFKTTGIIFNVVSWALWFASAAMLFYGNAFLIDIVEKDKQVRPLSYKMEQDLDLQLAEWFLQHWQK